MTTAPRKPPVGRFFELQREVKIPDDYVLTSKIRIKPPTREQMRAFRAAQTDDELDRAFLGDQYEATAELYKDRPEQEWSAFTTDAYKHFFGIGADSAGKSETSSES